MNEIENIFTESQISRKGFNFRTDRDGNKFLALEYSNIRNIIWVNYGSANGEFNGLGSSIVFTELQKEYADLCFPIITKNQTQKLDKGIYREQINNPTINCGVKVESPIGILKSKFENYLPSEFIMTKGIESLSDHESLVEYFNLYYSKIEISFFSQLKSLEDLDELTDNLNLYELSLYLTNVPKLKKILIKHLLNKPEAEPLRKDYVNMLKQNQGNKMVDLILSCLDNIKLKYGN